MLEVGNWRLERGVAERLPSFVCACGPWLDRWCQCSGGQRDLCSVTSQLLEYQPDPYNEMTFPAELNASMMSGMPPTMPTCTLSRRSK